MTKHNITSGFFLAILFLLAFVGLFKMISAWYFAGTALLWIVIVSTGSLYIGSDYHVKAYCGSRTSNERHIAITFDDGPSQHTACILDVLNKYHAKATFFCVGKNIKKHPDVVRRIVDDGHIVGNHSYTHSRLIDFYRKNRMIREISDTDALIKKISGKKPLFFRPPYGVTNPSIRRAVAATNHKVVGWNVRSFDGIISNEKVILSRIFKKISPGSIILLHDTKPQTAEVLEHLLAFSAENNLMAVTVERLLNLKAYED